MDTGLAVVSDGHPSTGISGDVVDNLLKRYEMCRQRRENWITVWEDCYEYCLPMRESFFQESPGQRRTDRIFDETAVVGVVEVPAVAVVATRVPIIATAAATFTAPQDPAGLGRRDELLIDVDLV